MALNQAQIDALSKEEGFKKGYAAGERTAASAMGDVALILIPGGTVIRAGRAGSKLFAAIRSRLKNAFGNVKVIKKPNATQIKNAKPPSSVLKADGSPKANVKLKSPEQVAINRLSGQGAKTKKAPPSSSNTSTVPKAKPKIAAPGLAKNRKPIAPKPKGNVKSTRKLADDVKAAAEKRAAQARMRKAQKRRAVAKKAAGAGAVAAGVTGAAIGLQKATGPKKAGASTPNTKKMPASGRRKPTGTYDRRAVPTGKPKRKPTGTYDRSPVETRKPKRGVGGSTPSDAQKRRQVPKSTSPTVSAAQKKRQTRTVKSTSTMSDAQKRRATRITAGPNVGFGPKGNIFPKNAADRQRLMKKYGGTGSAAARAAAQGKQGNLKKGSK